MIARIIADIRGYAGKVILEQDGVVTQLRTVSDIHIDESGMVTIALFAPDGADLKVEVSDLTAEAILRADSRRQLSFLSDENAAQLIDLRHTLLNVLGWPSDDSRVVPLQKIIAELERRAEVPF